MTPVVATAWLALAFVLAAMAYLAARTARPSVYRRYTLAALPACAVGAALAVSTPLGWPTPLTPPPGDYAVLGSRIDVDQAIYVLLDVGDGAPRYYVLAYSAQQANKLQAALDSQEQPTVRMSGEGEEFGSRPAPPAPRKDAPGQTVTIQ